MHHKQRGIFSMQISSRESNQQRFLLSHLSVTPVFTSAQATHTKEGKWTRVWFKWSWDFMRLVFLEFPSRPDSTSFLWYVCVSILSAFNTFISRTGCLLVTYYILPLWQVLLWQNNQCYWLCLLVVTLVLAGLNCIFSLASKDDPKKINMMISVFIFIWDYFSVSFVVIIELLLVPWDRLGSAQCVRHPSPYDSQDSLQPVPENSSFFL